MDSSGTLRRHEFVHKRRPVIQYIVFGYESSSNDPGSAHAAGLLRGRTPSTEGFRLSTEKFRDYADNFRDRWQSVFEIFMAGGNLPSAGAPYPADFAATVSQGLSLIR
jgi:hypothetical protein